MQPTLFSFARAASCALLLVPLLPAASATSPLTLPLVQQAKPSSQQMLMAKRAAELDAYRKLAEQIMGLQLKGSTTVEDFVTQSDTIRSRVDAFLRGARIVDTRYFSDGTAEVDAEVTIRQVVDELKKVRDEVYKDGRWATEDFEEIARKTKDSVIEATGCGAARAQSNIPDPATEPIVTPASSRAIREIQLPPIYAKFPPAERLKAKRAAELDAYRKLLERIGGLSLSSTTKVRDFILENDSIRTAVEGTLRGARVENVRYGEDGVVEVEVSVTIEQVVETIKKVHDEKYDGVRWKSEQFDEIQRLTRRKVIALLGTGALSTGGKPVEDAFDSGDPEVIIVE